MTERGPQYDPKRELAPIKVLKGMGCLDTRSGIAIEPLLSEEQLQRAIPWITNPDVSSTYFPSGKNPTQQDAESTLYEDVFVRTDIATYEIRTPDTIPIGHTVLHSISKFTRSAEFGIMIGELAYRREGYGRYATELTMYLARKNGYQKMRWDIKDDNVPSLRLIGAYEHVRMVAPRHRGFLAFMLDLTSWEPTLPISPVMY